VTRLKFGKLLTLQECFSFWIWQTNWL